MYNVTTYSIKYLVKPTDFGAAAVSILMVFLRDPLLKDTMPKMFYLNDKDTIQIEMMHIISETLDAMIDAKILNILLFNFEQER